MHRFFVAVSFVVTSAETGGLLSCNYDDPGGNARSRQVIAAGQAAGYYNGFQSTPSMPTTCAGGVPVVLLQGSALTAGAAVLWAEIWGS
jgi:hypothetical protein